MRTDGRPNEGFEGVHAGRNEAVAASGVVFVLAAGDLLMVNLLDLTPLRRTSANPTLTADQQP